MNYVRRCKSMKYNETFNKTHAADNNYTYCGKELNEMWYILSSAGMNVSDINCKQCLKKVK